MKSVKNTKSLYGNTQVWLLSCIMSKLLCDVPWPQLILCEYLLSVFLPSLSHLKVFGTNSYPRRTNCVPHSNLDDNYPKGSSDRRVIQLVRVILPQTTVSRLIGAHNHHTLPVRQGSYFLPSVIRHSKPSICEEVNPGKR
jgi:hypothetical protein